VGRRLLFLDGLRAIAAVSVLIQHMFERTVLNEGFKIVSPGLFGVVLFFFISGFIIPYSVGSTFNPDKFAITRVCRIFPAYLLVVVLSLGLGWLGVGGWAQDVNMWGNDPVWLVANLLTVAEYVGKPPLVGVAWTLPMEFFWYATFAVLFAAYGRRFALRLTIAMSLLLLAASVLAVHLNVRLPIGRLSLVNVASVGYLFYLYHQQQLTGRGLAAGIAAFLAATPLAFIVTYTAFPHPNVELVNILLTWGTALTFFALVMLTPSLRSSALLTNPLLGTLGEISYSIYLFHGIVLGLLAVIGLPFAAVVVLGPLLTFGLSWLTYHHVERTGMAVGKRLFHSLQNRDVEIVGYCFRKIGLAGANQDA
jgi:peptidoglycan/LPS O-acetylase OafA/YrhL